MEFPEKLAELRLEEALRLLEDLQSALPARGEYATFAQLQHLIDGLCGLSLRDGLTGIANLAHFRAMLERELDRVSRTGEVATLLLLGVDQLKRVKDRFGLVAGERVLRGVARKLAKWLRPMDFVARVQDEVFGAILPATLAQHGRKVGDRLRRKIAKMEIDLAGASRSQVTVSIGGAAVLPWRKTSAGELMRLAERQLYIARETGRNRVSFEAHPSTGATAEERAMLLERFEKGIDDD